MRRIAGTCRVAAAAALLSVPTIAVLPAQAADPEGFHVQFGTRVQGPSASGGGDSGQLVGESRNGAVIVAGYAAGMRSDTGGIPPRPMLAAFSRDGRLLWQQNRGGGARRGMSLQRELTGRDPGARLRQRQS